MVPRRGLRLRVLKCSEASERDDNRKKENMADTNQIVEQLSALTVLEIADGRPAMSGR